MAPVVDAISTMAELIRCDGGRSRFDGLAAFRAGRLICSAEIVTTAETKRWSLAFEGFGDFEANETSKNLELLAVKDCRKDKFKNCGDDQTLVPIDPLKNESADYADDA